MIAYANRRKGIKMRFILAKSFWFTLAFLCSQESDICIAGPDGLDIINLTSASSDEHSPAWSPGGSRVAYVSAESLMLVRADRTHLNFLGWCVFNPPMWRP